MGGDFACDIRLQECKERPFIGCHVLAYKLPIVDHEGQRIARRSS
jgi:hypothetical protein